MPEYLHYENKPIQKYWKFYHRKKRKKKKKKRKFSDKISDILHISAQNIDYGYSLEPHRRGGSNEYLYNLFLSKNKKNNVYPCKPTFYYTKEGFKGGQHYIGMFSWWRGLYIKARSIQKDMSTI